MKLCNTPQQKRIGVKRGLAKRNQMTPQSNTPVAKGAAVVANTGKAGVEFEEILIKINRLVIKIFS